MRVFLRLAFLSLSWAARIDDKGDTSDNSIAAKLTTYVNLRQPITPNQCASKFIQKQYKQHTAFNQYLDDNRKLRIESVAATAKIEPWLAHFDAIQDPWAGFHLGLWALLERPAHPYHARIDESNFNRKDKPWYSHISKTNLSDQSNLNTTLAHIYGIYLLGTEGVPIDVPNARAAMENRLEKMYSATCGLFAPYLMLNIGIELLERAASWRHAQGYWSYWRTQWEIFRHGKTILKRKSDYGAYSLDLERLSRTIMGHAKRTSSTTASDDTDFLRTSLLDNDRLHALADMLYITQHDQVTALNHHLNQYFQTVRAFRASVWYDYSTWFRTYDRFDSEKTLFWRKLASVGFAMVKTGSRLIRGLELYREEYKILRQYRPPKRVLWFFKASIDEDVTRGLANLAKWDDLPRDLRHVHPRILPAIFEENLDAEVWEPIMPSR